MRSHRVPIGRLRPHGSPVPDGWLLPYSWITKGTGTVSMGKVDFVLLAGLHRAPCRVEGPRRRPGDGWPSQRAPLRRVAAEVRRGLSPRPMDAIAVGRSTLLISSSVTKAVAAHNRGASGCRSVVLGCSLSLRVTEPVWPALPSTAMLRDLARLSGDPEGAATAHYDAGSSMTVPHPEPPSGCWQRCIVSTLEAAGRCWLSAGPRWRPASDRRPQPAAMRCSPMKTS